MNFKRLIYIVSIVLLIIVGVNYIGETYSQFKTDGSSRGDAQIAKWMVALKDGETELENKFDVTFVSTSNNEGKVALNRLAPGTSGQATLVLDLTNTEVSVDYNITVDTRVLEKQIGSSNITLTMLDGNNQAIEFGKYVYVPLVNKEKFTDSNGIFKFNFYLTWNNDSDSNDLSDTNIALNFENLTLPVSVKIKQHIEDSNYEEENKKKTSNISYAETTETKQRETQGLNYRFNEQDVLSNNPEKGFYSSSTIGLNESGLVLPEGYYAAVTKSKTNNLLYLKVDLSAFSGSMNKTGKDLELTSAAISALANMLEQIKQNNNTIILRFVYDNNATGVVEGIDKFEPGQAMLLKHIAQLGPTLTKYASTINVIQMGFYGLWGESYYNTDVNSHPEYYKQTAEALLKATAGTDINIALRTPSYYTSYREINIEDIENDITTSDEDAYRVGIFNDAYGASYDDLGTYTYDREAETNWLHNQASHTFFGGEAIIDSGYDASNPSSAIGPYNTAMYFIQEAFKLHTSYVNWEWNQLLHEQWAKQTYTGDDPYYYGKSALTYIENHLGYRFVVKEVRTYENAESKGTLPIDITVENVGFANLIKGKRADIVLTDNSGKTVKTYEGVNIDAKDFLSQTTIKKSISINLPELALGEYKVYLRLSNGEVLNNGNYYGAIQFANDNMYNSTLEANYIAEFTVK